MSATWYLLSPLSAKKMNALEEECQAAIDAHLEEHPDSEDTYGEIAAGGVVPGEAEVVAAHQRLSLPAPDDKLLKRLARCKSALSIDRPGALETDPLQVSILRFLLERIGKGLVLFNDYPLETADDAIVRLQELSGAPGFEGEEDEELDDDVVVPPPGPITGTTGMDRASRILGVFKAVDKNTELAIDVRRAFARVSELARRYAALIYEDGVMPDALAAKALGVPSAELERAAAALDEALRDIRD
jgi:hypothetical protein